MKMKRLVVLGVIGLTCLSLVACTSQNMKQDKNNFNRSLVQTVTGGKIKGHEDEDHNVLEWLGLPYAKAERWEAPTRVDKWSETLDATKAGESDIQFSSGKVSGIENALNLDISRPNSSDKNLPVIVYIHGGNNQTGTAQEIQGNDFVNDINAVYVSVNYRLGVFGFNPLQALKTGTAEKNSGNYALLDILAALDWVQGNIETFGGNKDNVTLAGFSAGGRDVMATLISPMFKGKYNKAISFSGGMTLADMSDSQTIFAKAIAPLVVNDGVKSSEEEAQKWLLTSGSDVADYLAGLSAERLAQLMDNAAIRMSVFPHLYKDGTVIPKEGFSTSSFNDVPLLLFTGTNEFSLFAAYDNYFARDFTSGRIFHDSEKMAAFDYVKNYGGQLYRLSNGVESAKKLSGNYKSPIYIGEISYGDDSQVTPDLARTFGAFHGIFEPMLQSPSNYASIIGNSFDNKGAQAMSKDFKLYLKQFLDTGDPNKANLTRWSSWSDNNQVLTITANQNKKKIMSSQDNVTAEEVLTQMNADTTLSDSLKYQMNTQVLNGRWFSSVVDSQFK
ncbi:carboxylesterase family protein [Streptococcus saliviloxodontae]|uniref:Carboxylic ester hydrolase n=1 Tax=Streptococcus saliviloxodontae TaxID=1349416 RepID=A0ABS2PLY9_9STRE|nr:carboxylesterase family protein [Streptococcus saliviloxodontae]MBM7636010.1 para-nitrobenzyl esterase [Streptococcus saliviloxodontae]